MNAHRFIVVLLLVALAAPALLAEVVVVEPEVDLRTITPEDLGTVDTRSLVVETQKAYEEKRYEDAARGYVACLKHTPGDQGMLYNLACCFGLMKDGAQAARFLEAAYRAGFRDLGHIRHDADFEAVREHDAFAAVMTKLEKADAERQAARGELLEVVTPFVATVRMVEPTVEMNPWLRYPLVIGLHGYGDNSENFAALFVRRGLDQPFIYVAVQAPYASHGGGRIGFSWSYATEGGDLPLANRSHDLDEKYVLRVLETVKRRYRVDERKVFLMGFSQGAGQAFSIGMKHPDLFRGVIPIGGWLDAGEHPAERVKRAARDGLFLICHSPEDRVVEPEAAKTAVEYFRKHGIPHALLEYPGGHSLPIPLMKAVAAWIADPGPEAPALPPVEEKTAETPPGK